jgi:hypothetical protein
MAKPLIYPAPIYEGVAGQRLRFDIFEEIVGRSHPAAVPLAARSVAIACTIESRDGVTLVVQSGACSVNAQQNYCAEYALTADDLAALLRGSYTAWLYVTKEGAPLAQQPPPVHFEVERSRAVALSAGQDDSYAIVVI